MAPLLTPSTKTDAMVQLAFGVMVKDRLSPSVTLTDPLGLMLTPLPADAAIV
jgi:hypothetical protein